MQTSRPTNINQTLKSIEERLESGAKLMKQEIIMLRQHVRDMEVRIEKLELQVKPA